MTTEPIAPSVAELISRITAGERVRFLFFWGHQPGRDGAGCLSQWWSAPFTVDGIEFRTAEHYMMWRKAILFGDAPAAVRVLATQHPAAAKKVGRQVRGFDQQTWEEHRYGIVVAGNRAKFSQHPDLARFLLGTGDRVLVEASPIDRIWGIGLAARDDRAGQPQLWRGHNLLGFALMRVRTDLRCANASDLCVGPGL